ncbi:MAG: hypothetical protein A2525_05330 [Sulfurimonas sp. RIFOXYD12_FULL_36_11]|jgi:HEPN domain-containing protein|nr:MAG: hypothetical protein A2525_05330 [Sulfurimonas sp. RIFOXYD12_FULL_36_11]OHE19115.1 MAG: hypothetical protein A2540_08125 [Sulfurimonas sp. RIFOXYD2_FULL_37_8]
MSNLSAEWLKAAFSDIVVMDSIVGNDLITHMTAFHSQQCIEKSLKAILEYHGITIPRKHDILLINELVSEYILIADENMLDKINALYTDSRYPGDIGLLPYGKPTLKDAKEFYEFAQDIFNQVCTLLNIDPEEIKK